MTYEYQDKFNSSKVWVIRKNHETGEYEWNQKIDGNLFYDNFSTVELGWIQQVIGKDVAEEAERVLCGRYLNAGDDMQVFVNQGWRDAMVLGVDEGMMIVEYEMPAGTTAMLLMPRDGSYQGKSVSYRTCPKKWINAIRLGCNSWTGISQTGTTYDFPEAE